jgi:sulfur carrier protein ThiS adenylyltransferase
MVTIPPNLDDRYSRQRDIIPTERLSSCRATVIGVGAIGRPVALQLTAMGIPWLQLVDFDVVEPSNLASQGYMEDDLGQDKVAATRDQCLRINRSLEIHVLRDRFRRSMEVGNVIFVAVDKIEIRRLIWESIQGRVLFFVDGRMSEETLRVLTASDAMSTHYYPSTLFAAEQAYAGSCTAKSTIYCANIAAGLMLAQFTKYLRHFPIDYDIQLNLLTLEMSVGAVA